MRRCGRLRFEFGMIGDELVSEKPGNAQAVENSTLEDHAQAFGQGNPDALGDFAGIGLELGNAEVAAGIEQVARVVEGIEARVEEEQRTQVGALEAGFLADLAGGCGFGGFTGVDPAARDFPRYRVDEEAVLPDQEDALGVVDDNEAGAGADFGDEVFLGEAVEGDRDTTDLLVAILVDDFRGADHRRRHDREDVRTGGGRGGGSGRNSVLSDRSSAFRCRDPPREPSPTLGGSVHFRRSTTRRESRQKPLGTWRLA